MRACYYSPILARFVSVDPVMGKTASSQSWNRYSYVLNNPLRFVDPDGRIPAIPLAVLVGRAVSGGASGAVTGGAYYLIRSKVVGNEITLGGAVNATAKGGVIGAGSAIPALGAAGAAFSYEYVEQRVKGASSKDAVDKAALVAAGAAAGSLATAMDGGSNVVGGLGAALAASLVGDAISGGLGEALPQQTQPPDGSADQLKSKSDQMKELRDQGLTGGGSSEEDDDR